MSQTRLVTSQDTSLPDQMLEAVDELLMGWMSILARDEGISNGHPCVHRGS